MKSLLIEFHRFDDLGTGILRKGDRYLSAAANHPVHQVKMPISQAPFLDNLKSLRYQADTEKREAALKRMSAVVTTLLGARGLKELKAGDDLLQLDLVVNAAELAPLPFEMLTDGTGEPLLVRKNGAVELTRRVRKDFAESTVRWPARPRILYVWASPPGVAAVPHEEHERALRVALEPWMPAQGATGAGTPLTVLPKAGIETLHEACASSVQEEKPFTHVHILAHGYPVDIDHRKRFGLALHDRDGELAAVPPEKLTQALAPLSGYAVVVTLAACDAANDSNTIVQEKSIAHELHESGFPVVLASQLPLTVPGSTVMVDRFYRELLAGKDVRMALHEARLALYDAREQAGHDWASLVAYVRLPEGYADYLQEVRLAAVMASLRIARERSLEPVATAGSEVEQLDAIMEILRGRIQDLEAFLPDTRKAAREAMLLENLGLLGSANKRLAELVFARSKRHAEGDWQTPMRDALEKARLRYLEAYECNLSHHWSGVQYLSLQAALDGT
ncbi:MAG TPA: CHAT domain-containing protein, partial [Thermoanaerobaculia bacterium]|nr:CHAT domain-containing protein [Thermoanaerobaculia bacterium]